MTPEVLLWAAIVAVATLLVIQGAANIHQTLFIWNRPERLGRAAAPVTRERPKHGFSVLLPARHEQTVIGETLRRLGHADYPRDLVEFLVICSEDDEETIDAAESAIRSHRLANARVVTFDTEPGKARAMNIGLAEASHDVVTVFDSEDDVSPQIFSIMNTLFIRERYDVIQGGVQLMDWRSHWYSVHNVLEYFLWFKSRMHYFAQWGNVPLGGNTVFFRTSELRRIGGWDEDNLTEDADVGVRLSLAKKRIGVMYDPEHVTREEVPTSTPAFVKQRTRWNQGFLQILRKGEWRRLTLRGRILIGYLLIAPTAMAVTVALAPAFITVGLLVPMPVVISMLTYVPLLLALVMLLTTVVGLHEFARDQHQRIGLRHYLLLAVTFLPYQLILALSSVRAIVRDVRGHTSWEKTFHAGGHRIEAPEIAAVSISGEAA